MAQLDAHLTTGLSGFDRMIKGLIPGDNLVWQLDDVDQIRPFVSPYGNAAEKLGYPLVYFRFASHEPLIGEGQHVKVRELDPADGFEPFVSEIHETIQNIGRGGFYVFDCLSELAVEWYSDQMLGNFFRLTCPYLYDVEALAYFPLLRNHHSFMATAAIADTTQILTDIYEHRGRTYVHPWKVQARFSPTMHMLHVRDGEDFIPVSDSATIAEILTASPWSRLESSGPQMGQWDRNFLEADSLSHPRCECAHEAGRDEELFRLLLRTAISRDERVLALLEKHLTLEDVVQIGKRMIGTGLIGGKSVGMLLARAMLRQKDEQWAERLEAHDSFYIGSDVFYTFLVRNGLWWARQRQKDPQRFLEGIEQARQRIQTGTFPDYIQKQFEDMLDYFGQSPIIVRSSSLLEDNFGNAFAGKYESVFCVNQGPRQKRLEDFLSAVKTVYASSMSEKALTYRAQRGLLELDEQMALLVQRVSGAMYGHLYFPQIAGVGFSHNPYVWNRSIQPEAGMMRLVFALGTRAVDRNDDDYTRIVALDAPDLRPEANLDEVREYSQRRADVLDLDAGQLVSRSFQTLELQADPFPLNLFAEEDTDPEARAAAKRLRVKVPRILTFEKLFKQTQFVPDIRRMLSQLQEAYDYPVDVEFAANFQDEQNYKINVVQCRPLQIKEGGSIVEPPPDLSKEDRLVEAHGIVIGQSRLSQVDQIIYIVPRHYGELPVARRYAVARLIGKATQSRGRRRPGNIMLLGPGRWGTTTPSLGIPVRFAEISNVSIICEIVTMRDNLVPDVSLGTHFFSEMVELDMLYFALFPHKPDNVINEKRILDLPNRLLDVVPEADDWTDMVRMVDAADLGGRLLVNANPLKQRVVAYVEEARPDEE